MAVLGKQSTKSAFAVKAGDHHRGRSMHIVGTEVSVKISSQDTNGAYTVFRGDVPPLSGPPLHRHRHQDESWYIVKGKFRFLVDGEMIAAGPGDIVFAPKGSIHTFQNIGSETGVVVTTVVPGGVDDFFRELSAVAPQGVEPNPAVLIPVFEKYDLELKGPPLSVSHGPRA